MRRARPAESTSRRQRATPSRTSNRISNRTSSRTSSDTRFAGLSRGTIAWIGAWLVGAAIARLTGAAAVLLGLAGALVAFVAAAYSARSNMRRLVVRELSVAPSTTVGLATPLTVALDGPTGRHDGLVRISDGHDVVAAVPFDSLDASGAAHLHATFPRAGLIDQLTVEVIATGPVGAIWMRRGDHIDVDDIAIAPLPVGPNIDIEVEQSAEDGDAAASHGPRHGDVDGIRVWRDGDGDAAIHWPSTVRSGTLVVHDREVSSDRTWLLTAPDADVDEHLAGRFAATMAEGLRLGHRVVLRRHPTRRDAGTVDTIITDRDAAKLHSATLVGRRSASATPRRQRWIDRSVHVTARADTFATLTPVSRWLTALASLIALGMLVGALGDSALTIVLGICGIVAGALASLWASGRDAKPTALQVVVVLATLGSLVWIASSLGGLSGLLAALRGPMPDLLMVLLVIHGFEVVDRRTLRVHQAISGVIIAYAAGLRIDDRIGLWMGAWAVVTVLAVRHTGRRSDVEATTPSPGSTFARIGRPLGAVAAAVVATLAVLLIVPVPDGPARLGLPALSNGSPEVPNPGGLAGPSGGPPPASDGTRGSLGQVGGYPGFAETMDTSVRGDLGDEIVMRVRSPQPDFWRGQTFSEFDGRFWTVSPEPGQPRPGPRIEIPPTLGDRPAAGLPTEELIQTYFIEADLPNVVFAAARPDVITFDGSIFARPDGALRSNVTLTPGSVYTVVSERVQVTAELLRSQGDVAAAFAGVEDPRFRTAIDQFLTIPASTSQRTIDLATRLNTPGQSTYDTIIAYQSWLARNTEYDLNAPIPADGADAVDDYLFVSQRGFCEQIASSLAIMLRSQGVPARLATGYIPGVRDQVSGVFEVRASDAHAWVEVWFPESGWQAFDPTASVPLSGEADQTSVGADLLGAAISGVASRPVEIGALVAVGLSMLGLYRWATERLRRHRRGRWGVLQDRFAAAAPTDAVTNPQRATAFAEATRREAAADLADLLDRVAFDPGWHDSDDEYQRARASLEQLVG